MRSVIKYNLLSPSQNMTDCLTEVVKVSQSRGPLKHLPDTSGSTKKKRGQNEAILGRSICQGRQTSGDTEYFYLGHKILEENYLDTTDEERLKNCLGQTFL